MLEYASTMVVTVNIVASAVLKQEDAAGNVMAVSSGRYAITAKCLSLSGEFQSWYGVLQVSP